MLLLFARRIAIIVGAISLLLMHRTRLGRLVCDFWDDPVDKKRRK